MAQIETFQMLADPTRLKIVEILREGERPVNDIVRRVEIDQSGVSRHLRILHDGGFVRVRPAGQKRLYSLRSEPFQDLDAWISSYRSMWEKRLARFEAALRARQKGRSAHGSREKGK